MEQVIRYCILKGHESQCITHRCTYESCLLPTKWICPECLLYQIHQHGQQNNNHIKNKEMLLEQFIKDIYDLYVRQNKQKAKVFYRLNLITKMINEVIENLKNILNWVQKVYQDYQFNTQIIKINKLKDLLQNSFYKMSNDQIKQLLEVSHLQLTNYMTSQTLDSIRLQTSPKILTKCKSQLLINNILEIEQNFNNTSHNYELQIIENSIKDTIHGAEISPNDQYLAYGNQKQIIKIYDLTLMECIHQVQMEIQFTCCTFSLYSQILYIGTQLGSVQMLDLHNNYSIIGPISIHSKNILNLIEIQDRIILTSSADGTIIQTDLINNQQLLKIQAHNSQVYGLDYHTNLIISSSNDKSIKLWNQNSGKNVLTHQKAHNQSISQIRYINNLNQILSLDANGCLKLWKIHWQSELILLREMNLQDKIVNFSLIKKFQTTILVCQFNVIILNQDWETILSLEHQANNINQCLFDLKQPESMNFILIRSLTKLQVLRINK